ncbi:cytohesin-4 isoform X2 [Ornithorhynchus anatinus]|nr:cytohesin-4 isoform X2 [Ornithorhynchus anatinus]
MAQKEKELCIGRKKFNMDPIKGIQYLIDHKLLSSKMEDIAEFLYKGEGLNKTAIGDYLGERDPLNLQVLQAFVELHQFSNLNLVQALRQFLWSFRLPGEAQKIDRMMEAFATRYCVCNPGVFQSTDTCYVLSFSVIMLNTSLHNPNVRDKPPFERFVSMNRGINEGGDLPEELLKNLFESIKSEPFSIPEDDGNDLTHTFFNPDLEGWLLKLGQRTPGHHSAGEPLCPEGGRPQEAVLPGALQPQLQGAEDKGLQDGRGWEGGGGQAPVLQDLRLQLGGAGPVDQGDPGQHHPGPLLRPGLRTQEEDRQQTMTPPRVTFDSLRRPDNYHLPETPETLQPSRVPKSPGSRGNGTWGWGVNWGPTLPALGASRGPEAPKSILLGQSQLHFPANAMRNRAGVGEFAPLDLRLVVPACHCLL